MTVQGPHGSEGLGAALRDIAYSRPPLDETGGNAYRFGLLDGLRWGKFLTEVPTVPPPSPPPSPLRERRLPERDASRSLTEVAARSRPSARGSD